jgi:hypothetical protein
LACLIIAEAVANDRWIEIGPLAEEHDRPKRPIAHYRAYDGTVELYGKTYRACIPAPTTNGATKRLFIFCSSLYSIHHPLLTGMTLPSMVNPVHQTWPDL